MIHVRLARPNDLEEWRGHARRLLNAGIDPADVVWTCGEGENDLFGEESLPAAEMRKVASVPRSFLDLAALVLQHSDAERFSRLYAVLVRLQAEPRLLQDASDKDNNALTRWASAVRRDSHKMKAFVRFRRCLDPAGEERFLAWFEPDHFVLEATAPFFARRFAGMRWGIVTPYASAWWDEENLSFGAGGRKGDVPAEDAVEGDWTTYYASIFNPARLKVAMMKSEMPVKYWRNLPEAAGINALIRNAKSMEQAMIERAATQPPARHLRRSSVAAEQEDVQIQTLEQAHEAVQACRRCPLHEHATQAVFGEGPTDARVMFVGEQPGDQEDLAGRPFVGPAGQVFDKALEKIGIPRERVYVTNAVKHFKFVPRGKRRIHQRPDGGEIVACRFWLDLERDMVKPAIVVALGATAAQSLLGRSSVTIGKLRGQPTQLPDGTVLFVTNHPSYLLRLPDPAVRAEEQARFEADLARVRDAMLALENAPRLDHPA